MEDIEIFIKENRSDLDTQYPDRAFLWEKISEQLRESELKKVPLWKKTYRWAAIIFLLIGLSSIMSMLFLSYRSEINSGNNLTYELESIDIHYKGLVSTQVASLINHPKLSNSSKAEYLSFLDELDKEYFLLRKELEKGIDNEVVLEAIISNYNKRIELIERLLKLLNDSNLKEDNDAYTL